MIPPHSPEGHGTTDLKNIIIQNIGFMASMASSRDINAAWNDTKKKAAKEYSEKFILNDRGRKHPNFIFFCYNLTI